MNDKALNVLVIDDDLPTGEALVELLGIQGYSSTHVESGAAALELARKKRFDLLVLDVVMPVMNGYELLSALDRDVLFDGIPVVMLTAMAFEDKKKSSNKR